MSQRCSPSASTGEVNVTVVAKALHTKKLCGTEVPVVPAQGHVDTETKLLRVQVSRARRWACAVLSPGAELHPEQSPPERSISSSLGQAGRCPWVLRGVGRALAPGARGKYVRA